MKKIIRLALAAAVLLVSSGAAYACEDCANCPMHKKATTADAAPTPGDKKPGEAKPNCECTKGKDCACAKAGKPCKCAQKAQPKAA